MSATTIALTLLVNTFLTTFFTYNLTLADWWALKLYKAGYLKRRFTPKNAPPRQHEDRVKENSYVYFLTLLLPVSYLVANVWPVVRDGKLDTSMRLFETWASLCGIYIIFDAWYYFTHRFVHDVPFLYQKIHKRHHEDIPVNTLTTAHAETIENLIFVTPSLLIWAITYLSLAPSPNLYSIVIPALSLTSDFGMVHIGYLDHPYVYLINPFSYIMQLTLGARGLCARHELHHLVVRKNYGPMLPYLDRVFGTAREIVREEWGVEMKEGMTAKEE